ncbi:hypothetical protein XU18_2650 [Perkinsela sp. CCAP 1560/4]|nr:hypothetical protein XU18_2650 [Perkinsela sp. CCAP 1560/4]|eukprot:KNH06446.1 hypothetical protein XU18_2650 [Perkinsela sp. CCAP 1560/4]
MSRARQFGETLHRMGNLVWIPIIGGCACMFWAVEKVYVRPNQITVPDDFLSYRLTPIRDEKGKLLAYRKMAVGDANASERKA